MKQQLIRSSVLTVTENRNIPRLWIEGKYLKLAGFSKGCKIQVKWSKKKLVITPDDDGARIVSERRQSPIIDLNNHKLKQLFEISDKVQVLVEYGKITVERTKKEQRRLEQLHDGSFGSVFSGGGLIDKAAELAGLKPKFAIESEKQYADVYQKNHKGIVYNCDVSDVDYTRLSNVEYLLAGIECKPFSPLQKIDAASHEAIDLSMFLLMVVEAVNPRVIVIEQVPRYLKSEIGHATIRALKRMGYNVEWRLFKGHDFGEIQFRRRAVIVASMDEICFPEKLSVKKTMRDILVSPDHPECEWFDETSKPWFFEHIRKEKEKGNFFLPQILTEESTSVNAITSRYYVIQGNNPIVQHPFKKNTFRLLIPSELKKLFNLPQSFYTGPKNQTSEILGQGVIVNVFRKILETIMVTH